ncbi:hypothetical protein C8J24_1717 [Sphingomonas aerolata]|uniref:Lipoprotein n=1 Tax=Sphingomonas aerolata TaxID=185951 RepID=A0A2T4YPQ2_9SPHN|nr:hypothetical protein [Sphingomonas aerolata]PTM45496.1 hypothetical protein C8J24_1717 [Sphingomonas aerolata]
MRIAITVSLALIISANLSACSDPKAASKDNFQDAIEPVVKNAFCRPLPIAQYRLTEKASEDVPAFPIVIGAVAEQWAGSTENQVRSMLEAAAKEGFLERTEKTTPAAYGSSDALKPTHVVSYEPSNKGKGMFRGIAGKRAGSPERPNVCAGDGKIDEIVRWTEPADAFGQTMTQVTYTYSGTNFVEGAPKEMIAAASKPKEATITLVKMSDGWQAMK